MGQLTLAFGKTLATTSNYKYLSVREKMNNILEFPTKSVQDWRRMETAFRKLLVQSDASEELSEVVLNRMREAYEDHKFDYQLTLSLSQEDTEYNENQLNLFIKALQERTNNLLYKRLLLEVKLARAQGY